MILPVENDRAAILAVRVKRRKQISRLSILSDYLAAPGFPRSGRSSERGPNAAPKVGRLHWSGAPQQHLEILRAAAPIAESLYHSARKADWRWIAAHSSFLWRLLRSRHGRR